MCFPTIGARIFATGTHIAVPCIIEPRQATMGLVILCLCRLHTTIIDQFHDTTFILWV